MPKKSLLLLLGVWGFCTGLELDDLQFDADFDFQRDFDLPGQGSVVVSGNCKVKVEELPFAVDCQADITADLGNDFFNNGEPITVKANVGAAITEDNVEGDTDLTVFLRFDVPEITVAFFEEDWTRTLVEAQSIPPDGDATFSFTLFKGSLADGLCIAESLPEATKLLPANIHQAAVALDTISDLSGTDICLKIDFDIDNAADQTGATMAVILDLSFLDEDLTEYNSFFKGLFIKARELMGLDSSVSIDINIGKSVFENFQSGRRRLETLNSAEGLVNSDGRFLLGSKAELRATQPSSASKTNLLMTMMITIVAVFHAAVAN